MGSAEAICYAAARMMDVIRLDLSKLLVLDGVEVLDADDGSLGLRLQVAPGAYGAVSPPIREWWPAPQLPAVVYVDLEVDAGAVGIALFAPDLGSLLSGERRVTR